MVHPAPHPRIVIRSKPMIAWLKQRRLKMASILSIGGDGLMGMGGAAGLFSWIVPNSGAADVFLMVAGAIAVIGHIMVVLFGHGGARADGKRVRGLKSGHIARALMPWRYPLDFGLAAFVCSGLLYATAGYLMANHALIVTGILVFAASLTGWLGLASMRVTAGIFMTATVMQFWAAWLGQNVFMFLSALCYAVCNVILATVRKEHQSAYTLDNPS